MTSKRQRGNTTSRGHAVSASLLPATVAHLLLWLTIPAWAQADDYCAKIALLREATRSQGSGSHDVADRIGTTLPTAAGMENFSCRTQGPGSDWKLQCLSDWAGENGRLVKQVNETAEQTRDCLGTGWRRKVLRNSRGNTILIYHPAELLELSVGLERRLVDPEDGVGSALGVPGVARPEWRAALEAVGLERGVPRTGDVSVSDAAFCAALVRTSQDARTYAKAPPKEEPPTGDPSKGMAGILPCSLTDFDTSTTYSCAMGTYPTRSALRAAQSAFAQKIASCQGGASWKASPRPRGDGVWSVDFETEPAQATSLELRGTSRRGAYELSLDFDTDK